MHLCADKILAPQQQRERDITLTIIYLLRSHFSLPPRIGINNLMRIYYLFIIIYKDVIN